MLPTRHRLDIHDGETAAAEPRDACRYPLGHNEPTTQTGRNAMATEAEPVEPAAESPDITVWTTENSEAVVWGTHELPLAQQAYATAQIDADPDWNDVRRMWGAPHLLDLEVWDASDYGDSPEDGWVPYLVFGF